MWNDDVGDCFTHVERKLQDFLGDDSDRPRVSESRLRIKHRLIGQVYTLGFTGSVVGTMTDFDKKRFVGSWVDMRAATQVSYWSQVCRVVNKIRADDRACQSSPANVPGGSQIVVAAAPAPVEPLWLATANVDFRCDKGIFTFFRANLFLSPKISDDAHTSWLNCEFVRQMRKRVATLTSLRQSSGQQAAGSGGPLCWADFMYEIVSCIDDAIPCNAVSRH